MDGAFIGTFADPWLTYSADPRHDLDMTSTGLVKTYERGHGTTYPGLPWEPKQAFSAVASFTPLTERPRGPGFSGGGSCWLTTTRCSLGSHASPTVSWRAPVLPEPGSLPPARAGA